VNNASFDEFLFVSCGLKDVECQQVKEFQQAYGGKIASIVVVMGFASDEQVAKAYAEYYELEYIEQANLENWLVAHEVNGDWLNSINMAFIKRHQWEYVGHKEGIPRFISTEPGNTDVLQYFDLIEQQYECAICVENIYRDAQSRILESTALDTFDASSLSDDVDIERLREMASEAPIINLVNSLISRGIQKSASDMHIEPHKGMCRVRLRVDGVLQDLEYLPKHFYLPVVSRIKILGGMDIAEKRRPQDGKIATRVVGKDIDIRVSALPLNDGESIVMRFLLKQSVRYELDALGISSDIRQYLQEDIAKTAGVILLTGPTGSGKTTSLYSFLNQINTEDVKIITLEDPVEYQLDGINQIQVNSDIGFDFAKGLRSIVRQDPDTIMLGEIRDKETAQIAMQSSLTGHLVFSTVHTNDAPGAFTRLLDLGVEEFLLNASIVSIVAQRLARTNCSNCAEPLSENELRKMSDLYPLQDIANKFNGGVLELKRGSGCPTCSGSGYQGRIALIEYLRCDEFIKQQNKNDNFAATAHKYMKENAVRTLFEDGLLKVVQGTTTVDEISRVAG